MIIGLFFKMCVFCVNLGNLKWMALIIGSCRKEKLKKIFFVCAGLMEKNSEVGKQLVSDPSLLYLTHEKKKQQNK